MTDDFTWRLVNVYGPVQEDKKSSFLQEVREIVSQCTLPLIIGGDFNLVRKWRTNPQAM